MTATAAPPPSLSKQTDVLDTTRLKVRDMFQRSAAFQNLPPAQQKEIARNTVEILRYLSAPEGIPGNRLAALQQEAQGRGQQDLAQPMANSFAPRGGQKPQEKFEAVGAREGAKVAGLLLQEVNFPTFVSGLITGVFEAIVNSSIKQMEAYGQLVASVAQTLNSFRDQNVSENQGRDHLVEQFPDMFDLEMDTGGFDGGGGPRIRLREGVDERAALARVNSLPMEGGPLKSLDLEDGETEAKLVQASRTQLATSRQQLLATMVLMGINRIIVTDGRISAKVLYEFQAKDTFKRSATAFDYANMGTKTVSEEESESERQGPSYNYTGGTPGSGGTAGSGPSFNSMGGSYYAKGVYKTTQEPVVKLRSAEATNQDASLSARASLAGQVEVNFKSETFPLEKMADSFQIGAIQNASQPKSAAAAAYAAPAAPGAPAAPPAAAAPAPVAAPPPAAPAPAKP